MFCRKCGDEIPDDSVFCLKCGEKVETLEKPNDKIPVDAINNEEVNETEVETTEISETDKNTEVIYAEEMIAEESKAEQPQPETIIEKFSSLDNKHKYGIIGAIGGLILLIIIIVAINASKCNICGEEVVSGSDYCYYHKCQVDGCNLSKTKSDRYCFSHENEFICEWEEGWDDKCTSNKTEGSKYCYSHTCSQSGCTEKVSKEGYTTCEKHAVDMRKRLTSSAFYFSLNSAGGIEFDFSATNSTGKDIKYVRFDVILKNAVGDLVEDEIKDTSRVKVEIVGPVKPGKRVYMSDEIIGYCDTCARIDIQDITIIYTDGTSETGHYGYYYEN